MFRNKNLLILIFIISIAVFLRFYQITSVPPSPSLDEVSIGYNAYSILQTGQDEYGNRFPLLLRAYDDWRPALYVYLVIPFVKFFGLSVLAVRLPAVILSVLTVLLVYFLLKELFGKSAFSHQLSAVSSLLLAISPWHIYISRLGHEVNLGLTLSILGIYLFLKFVNRKTPSFLFLSAIFLALSFYTYQSQKLFGPLIILSLLLIYRRQTWRFKKETVMAGILGLVILLPLLKASLSSEALLRFKGTSIFTSQPEVYQKSSLRIIRDYNNNDLLGLIFDNRRVETSLVVLRAYFSHFDPAWLFFNTGEERHKIPGFGLLYLWELPLIIVGGYKLVKSEFLKESKLLILSWILIAPIPASITTEAPHAMRTFNMLPIPQVLVALGIVFLFSKLKVQTQRLKFLASAIISLFILFNFLYLHHNYFVNFPYEQSKSFQYALSRAIPYALDSENKYQKIVISNRNNLYQSYMFFLFFSKYNPHTYLAKGGTISAGYDKTHKIGKYEFRPIEWGKEEGQNILYIGNIDDFPESIPAATIFKLLNEKEVIKVVEKI